MNIFQAQVSHVCRSLSLLIFCFIISDNAPVVRSILYSPLNKTFFFFVKLFDIKLLGIIVIRAKTKYAWFELDQILFKSVKLVTQIGLLSFPPKKTSQLTIFHKRIFIIIQTYYEYLMPK